MVDCLRREFLYSDKRARDVLFVAIEEVLSCSTGEPLIVSRLARDATGHARHHAHGAGFAFANWDTTGKAVINAMLNAGVLLSPEGTSIPFGIAAQAAAVTALRPNYQDLTEAFLLEFLIRRLGDVTTRDHTALAHALFRQFDETVPIGDLEDRVVILVASLADRVELRGDAHSARKLRRK